MPTIVHQILGSFHVLLCLVSTFTMLYWLQPFYRLRNHPLLLKRRSYLTIVEAILCILGQIIVYGTWSIDYAQYPFVTSTLSTIFSFISMFIYPIIVYGIGFVKTTRYASCYISMFHFLFLLANKC